MILQALAQYYETLAAQGKLDRSGWSEAGISYALYINDDGALEQVVSLKEEQDRGKKKALVPRSMTLPSSPTGRTGKSFKPAFVWDNSSYILGADEKGNPQRSADCFQASKDFHHQLLDPVDSPAARALLAFFDHWEPALAREHPALADKLEDILKGANLVFRYKSQFLQEDPLLQQAWQDYYNAAEDGPERVCLITGKKGAVEPIHPSIKGVVGAQSSGATLVSFNAPAFCSYGQEQNFNAPVSKYAAFAYTSALNYLLRERRGVQRVGDTTVLFWAEDGSTAFQDLFAGYTFGAPAHYEAKDLQETVKSLCQGLPTLFDGSRLNPDMTFYVLGLSPNAARLSVRFFLKNSFGNFARSVQTHYERLEIARPSYAKDEFLPPWKLLNETVNQNSKDKAPVPELPGEVLRAILNDTPYPATLLNGIELRIRAERNITPNRAAILKAYYLKNPHKDVPKEVLTVSLNPNSTDISYTLGRLFSVYEAIQAAANPGISSTIKDRFFNSAAATPGTIFPILGNLSQKHLRKLRGDNPGLSVFYEKQILNLSGILHETYPSRLSLPQQGSFQLGYYQQTQARYEKKEEK